MKHASHDHHMQDCITACWDCRHVCQQTFYTHCLAMGGEHVAPGHAILMADCIAACQLAADMMVRNSPLHAALCRACAEICEACAQSCEDIGGDDMLKCAEACRSCAESCRAMAGAGMADKEGKEASGIMA